MLPQFGERLGAEGLRGQMEVVRELWESRGKDRLKPVPQRAAAHCGTGFSLSSPRQWQDTLSALVIGRDPAGTLAETLRDDPAIGVFRKLVWQVRAGMIVDNLTYSCRLLMLARGDDFLRALFDEYFAQKAPELFGNAESAAFAEYLAGRELDQPYLADMLAFERAAMQVNLDGERRVIYTRHDPSVLMSELSEGRVPSGLAEEDLEVVVG